MRKEFIALVLIFMLSCHVFPSLISRTKASSSTLVIDLYTQKEPFSGVGINQSSDAFAPKEEVILYGYVTYNLFPVANKIVAYEVYGPPNSIQNISFILTAETNASGIAEISFRIPWPIEDPEIIVFGVWTVFGSVRVAEEVVVDKLTFNVGWIVEITELRTVNQDLQPQAEFMRGTYMFVELSLRNIALMSRNTTLTLTTIDVEGYIVGNVILEYLKIEPNGTQIYCDFQLPEWAALGEAILDANISMSSDGLEPPQVITTFLIKLLGDLNSDGVVDIKDIALVALAFGSQQDYPDWNPRADITGPEYLVPDGKVDIRDIAVIAIHFGET